MDMDKMEPMAVMELLLMLMSNGQRQRYHWISFNQGFIYYQKAQTDSNFLTNWLPALHELYCLNALLKSQSFALELSHEPSLIQGLRNGTFP